MRKEKTSIHLVIDGIDYDGFSVVSAHKSCKGAVKKASKLAKGWKSVGTHAWRRGGAYIEVEEIELED